MTFKRSLILMPIFALFAVGVSAQAPAQIPPAQIPNQPFIQLAQPGAIEFSPDGRFALYGTEGHGMRAEEVQLAQQCDALIKELAKATGQEKDKIKTKLSETIDKQFDLRQKRHESEIAALEAQVKKLKDMVQKRQDNRKEIVGKRLDQLIRESEGLGW